MRNITGNVGFDVYSLLSPEDVKAFHGAVKRMKDIKRPNMSKLMKRNYLCLPLRINLFLPLFLLVVKNFCLNRMFLY